MEPASNALKESANAGINLVNLVLSPTGDQLDKLEVTHNPNASMTASIVSGAVSAIPYALAGGIVGKAMQMMPMGETAALVLRNGAFTQTAGAVGLDSIRDLRPGETRGGAMLGTAMGFGVFELGNSGLRRLPFAASLPLRIPVGVLGGITQSTFSDLGSGRSIDYTRWSDAATAGGAVNFLLPTAQYAIARSFALPVHGGEARVSAPSDESSMRSGKSATEQANVLVKLVATEKELPEGSVKATEQAPLAPPSPGVDLKQYPAFAVLGQMAARLRWEEQERVTKTPDVPAARSSASDLERTNTAMANMQKIADGKLPPETKEYIAKGWLPVDTLERMQARLRSDLEQVHFPDSDKTNLEDLAAYSHKHVSRGVAAKSLRSPYQGSLTRIALRSIGVESKNLEELYDQERNWAISAAHADRGLVDLRNLAATETSGMGMVDLQRGQEVRRAISGMERALVNPETREEALRDLNGSLMNIHPLIRKYGAADHAVSREPGPVDLSQHPSWQYAYRLLARLKEQRQPSLSFVGQLDAEFWASRSLKNMEQIAKGDFPPVIQRAFTENSNFLNNMRAQLDADLSRTYLAGDKPFGKQDLAATYSQFVPLLQKYEYSPLYRYLEATSGVPQGLDRLISNIRFWDSRDVGHGMKAVTALEHSLIDPETASRTLLELRESNEFSQRPELIGRYVKEYDRLYGTDQSPNAPSDYSSVVPFRRRSNGTNS
jgi:hypothetical protein